MLVMKKEQPRGEGTKFSILTQCLRENVEGVVEEYKEKYTKHRVAFRARSRQRIDQRGVVYWKILDNSTYLCAQRILVYSPPRIDRTMTAYANGAGNLTLDTPITADNEDYLAGHWFLSKRRFRSSTRTRIIACRAPLPPKLIGHFLSFEKRKALEIARAIRSSSLFLGGAYDPRKKPRGTIPRECDSMNPRCFRLPAGRGCRWLYSTWSCVSLSLSLLAFVQLITHVSLVHKLRANSSQCPVPFDSIDSG